MSWTIDITIFGTAQAAAQSTTLKTGATFATREDALENLNSRLTDTKTALTNDNKKVVEFNHFDLQGVTLPAIGTCVICSDAESSVAVYEVIGKTTSGWIVNSTVSELKPILTMTLRQCPPENNLPQLISELENLRSTSTAEINTYRAKYNELDFQYGSLLVSSRRDKEDAHALLEKHNEILLANTHLMTINNEMNKAVIDLYTREKNLEDQNKNLSHQNDILTESADLLSAQVNILRKINRDLEASVAQLTEQINILSGRISDRDYEASSSSMMLEETLSYMEEKWGKPQPSTNPFTPFSPPATPAPLQPFVPSPTRASAQPHTTTSPYLEKSSPFAASHSSPFSLMDRPTSACSPWSARSAASPFPLNSFSHDELFAPNRDRAPKEKWADIVSQLNNKFTVTKHICRMEEDL